MLNIFPFSLFFACCLYSVTAQSPPSDNASGDSMVHDFGQITPSPNISWTPCFDKFTCARLQVPLDYADPNQGTIAIAFIRIAASTQPAPTILFNPGGPGGSGISTALESADLAAAIFGTSFNIIGFDPRGVNNTTPRIDCFPDSPQSRLQFQSIYGNQGLVSDASSTAAADQFVAADAFGKWCSGVVGGTGPNGTARFASTPSVARDMLSFVEALQRAAGLPESEGQLWYYGISYGSALGATFASMFPNRIGRMVLDGIVDTEDYYNLAWRTNINDADEVVQQFFEGCFAAGKDRCAFWGPSVKDIKTRFDRILSSLKDRALPVADPILGIPQTATYSKAKILLLSALYQPLPQFSLLASVFSDLEKGNGTSLALLSQLTLFPGADDSGSIIPCVDGWGRGKVKSLEAWREYVSFLAKQSKYVGDAWGIPPLNCVSMDVPPPQSAMFPGSLPLSAKNTSFPLLVVNNLLDPVTPIRNARRLVSTFPGSVLLSQNGLGHTTLFTPSACRIQHIQAYLANGTMPAVNTTCEVDITPFALP